jgi:hypothetical protein
MKRRKAPSPIIVNADGTAHVLPSNSLPGEVIIISAVSVPRCAPYRWYIRRTRDSRYWYAYTTDRRGKPMSMHRLLADAYPHEVVHHDNHNTLDNRLANLG